MRDLFSPGRETALDPASAHGRSDFVAGGSYTYDDMAPGQTDYGMRHFSIAHDQAQILPLLRTALRLNPNIKVIATPWSPPAWMKTKVTDRRPPHRRPANLRRVCALLRQVRAGLPARGSADLRRGRAERAAEPASAWLSGNGPPRRPGSQAHQRPRACASNAGLHTKILGYDHNWSEHPDDVATTPPGENPETEYPCRPARQQRRPVAGRDRLPLLLGRPGAADRPSPGIPRQGSVVHRVLRLARADRPPGPGLLRHAEVARPQPCGWGNPQLGQDRRELEPGSGPVRRSAQGWLWHLHRRCHGGPGSGVHP